MKTLRHLTAAILLSLVPATALAAEPADTAAQDAAPMTKKALATMPGGDVAKHWAQQNGLPFKEIQLTLPDGERVTRVAVAVTPETWSSFKETFTKNRFIFNPDSAWGYSIFNGEGKVYGRKRDYGATDFRGHNGLSEDEGRSIVIDLEPGEFKHAQKWFAARNTPGDVHFCPGGGSACTDYLGNIELGRAPGRSKAGTTARVITHAEEAKRETIGEDDKNPKTPSMQRAEAVVAAGGHNLSQKLGIKRSKDPTNNWMNMAHVAGPAAGVIAVHMTNHGTTQETTWNPVTRRMETQQVGEAGNLHDRFHALTNEQVLGPTPPEGVAQVQRPRVQPMPAGLRNAQAAATPATPRAAAAPRR